MKMSHKNLIILAGTIWLAVGLFLFPLGVNFLAGAAVDPILIRQGSYPLISLLSPYVGGYETAAVVLITVALMVGSIKARKIFSKVVKKAITRITTFPNPTAVTNIFGIKYLLLIGLMICLGFLMRYFEVPKDVRGVIDVAVGSALIRGALAYYKEVSLLGQVMKEQEG